MIDLETLGTLPGSVFKQIGWALFDERRENPIVESGRIDVDRVDAMREGLTTSQATLHWWERQGEAAKAAMEAPGIPLRDALSELRRIHNRAQPYRVWGNGPGFDMALLEYAYATVMEQEAPWKFWNSRCVRTIIEHCPRPIAKYKPEIPHDGESDAIAQAKTVSDCLRAIESARS